MNKYVLSSTNMTCQLKPNGKTKEITEGQKEPHFQILGVKIEIF